MEFAPIKKQQNRAKAITLLENAKPISKLFVLLPMTIHILIAQEPNLISKIALEMENEHGRKRAKQLTNECKFMTNY